MSFRGGEFSTGTMGNFQPELTHVRRSSFPRLLSRCSLLLICGLPRVRPRLQTGPKGR